ncbi:iron chelate uptake ABC transporter family permease subunit [Corynebacterium ammoniagenes]|nr:iron chelate uptake ABC transporter family permease subunit [Corynebacterium ammoniagenes]
MSTPNISLPSTVSSTSRNSEDSGNSTATPRLVHALSAARHKRRRQYFALLIILTVTVIALWLVSLMIGETFYSPSEVIAVIMGETVPGASFTVGTLRLPRATVAIFVGLAFGMAGTIFQTMLRNQLASPDIIGISASASAAGATGIIVFGLGQTSVSIVSTVVSLTVAVVIYLLSIKSGFTGTRMILIGIGCAALMQAWTSYVLSHAAAWDLPTATRWITGSLNTMTWERGMPVIIITLLIAPLLVACSHFLSVLGLGDDLARGLGLRLTLTRVVLFVGAVTLIAIATAATGPIAFVAFMAGPIASRIFKPGTSLILPAGLLGALLVLVADIAGQYLFGTRYPVGVITGAIGAPFLIYLLTRSSR